MFISKRRLRKIILQQLDMLRTFQQRAEFDSTIRTCDYSIDILINVLDNSQVMKPADITRLKKFSDQYTSLQYLRLKEMYKE